MEFMDAATVAPTVDDTSDTEKYLLELIFVSSCVCVCVCVCAKRLIVCKCSGIQVDIKSILYDKNDEILLLNT